MLDMRAFDNQNIKTPAAGSIGAKRDESEDICCSSDSFGEDYDTRLVKGKSMPSLR